MIISRLIMLRMRTVSGRSWRENQNSFLCVVAFFFFFENRTFYEITWKNVVEADRPQITIRHVRSLCWICKATNTQSEYIIPTAFPQQVCFRELDSLLRLSIYCMYCSSIWNIWYETWLDNYVNNGHILFLSVEYCDYVSVVRDPKINVVCLLVTALYL